MCVCKLVGPPDNPMVTRPCAAHAAWRADYARNLVRAMAAEGEMSPDTADAAVKIIDEDLDAATAVKVR